MWQCARGTMCVLGCVLRACVCALRVCPAACSVCVLDCMLGCVLRASVCVLCVCARLLAQCVCSTACSAVCCGFVCVLCVCARLRARCAVLTDDKEGAEQQLDAGVDGGGEEAGEAGRAEHVAVHQLPPRLLHGVLLKHAARGGMGCSPRDTWGKRRDWAAVPATQGEEQDAGRGRNGVSS